MEIAGGARREKLVGTGCIVGTLVGWASILLFLKHLAPYLDAWTTNGWRYGISAVMLLPMLLWDVRRGGAPRGIWARAIVPAVLNAMGQVLYAFTPYYVDVALGGFLIRVSIVSSTLGAFILFADERVLMRSGLYWAGLAAVVGGCVGTVFLGDKEIAGATAIGVAVAGISGAFFGLYGVAVRYFMRGIPARTSFSVISLYTAAAMVGLMLVRGERGGAAVFGLSGGNWVVLVVSSIIGITICHVAFYAAIARLGVAVSTAIVQLSPFLCAVGAFFLYDERLTPGQWEAGVVMVIGAMGLLVAEQRRRGAVAVEPVCVEEMPGARSEL